MNPPDEQHLYRAIDDLKALMSSEFSSIRTQLRLIEKIDGDVENVKIQQIANNGVLHQLQVRVEKLEATDVKIEEAQHSAAQDRARDRRENRRTYILASVTGASVVIAAVELLTRLT